MIWMFKRAGAKNTNNKTYQIWRQDNHSIELTNRRTDRYMTYLHENPVRAGIVLENAHYKYSSAIDYQDGKGLVPVELLG